MSFIPIIFGSQRPNVSDPFSLYDWDSVEGFPFNAASSRPLADQFRCGIPTSAFVNANIDWRETATAHVIKADVPGLKKEEVKVEVEDGNVLMISGEKSREQEEEEETDTWHMSERSSGKFMRKFRMPENARVNQVKAAMENGVLTVTVPKVEKKERHVETAQSPTETQPTGGS